MHQYVRNGTHLKLLVDLKKVTETLTNKTI